MLCKACKRDIDADSFFCKYCGEKQQRERKKKAEVKVPAPKQLPSGTWYGRLMIDGQRVSISAESEKDYYVKARAAKTGLIKLEKTRQKITLRQAMRNYIDEHEAVVSPGTVRGWEYIIKGRFDNYLDEDIFKINYQQMISDEAKKYAPKTVRNAWALAAPAVKRCGVVLPALTLPQKVKYEGDFLDYEEIKIFLTAIRGKSAELAAILALHSLRVSEILDLTSGDVKDGYINVHGAVVRDKNEKLVHKDTNKNYCSARRVPVLMPRLYELLPPDGALVTLSQSGINRQIARTCSRFDIFFRLFRKFRILRHYLLISFFLGHLLRSLPFYYLQEHCRRIF